MLSASFAGCFGEEESEVVVEASPVWDFERPELTWYHFPDAVDAWGCLLYTSPSPRDGLLSRMPSSA